MAGSISLKEMKTDFPSNSLRLVTIAYR